jgi:hypothetical protein
MPEPAPALAKVAPAVRERMSVVVDTMVERIQSSIPLYREQTVVSTAALRESAVQNVEYLLSTAPPGSDLAASRRTGRQRALQGAPLPEILAGFRIGFALFWEAVADEYAAALTEAYRDTTEELLRQNEQERSALVEALTTGSFADRGTIWAIAAKLELPTTGAFAAVAVEVSTVGEVALPGIAPKLRAVDISSAWRLLPELEVGVVSLPRPETRDVVRIIGGAAPARVGISPVYPALEETPRALYLAKLALHSGPPGTSTVRRFDDTPLATLVAAAPEAATYIARHILGTILELRREDQDILLDTLETWLATGGSATDTAARLFCHPNTVRHRLRRIAERTGRNLDDPTALAELSLALHALRLLPGIR